MFVLPFVVVSVTDGSLSFEGSSLSLPSYCTPDARFWLSSDGLEHPKSCILVVRFHDKIDFKILEEYYLGQPDLKVRIFFEYDGGEYVGYLKKCIQYNSGRRIEAVIEDISSL
jgi:hypothetical protein